MKYQKIIVDADICIKIGSSEKYRFLENFFPLLADKIYMHRVVYAEIMSPNCAKQQVDSLIKKQIIEIVDENSLGVTDKQLYHATYQLLSKVMLDKTRPRKNLGEVCSLSMAKTKSIPIFATNN